MLGKLIKHEFRATARVMGLLLIAALALALLAGASSRILEGMENAGVLHLLDGLFQFAFVIAVIAVSVASVVVMIQRFYKNLLGDEGYLMFTLPANVHGLVWSKLIVSSVWFVATACTVALSCVIAVGIGQGGALDLSGFWSGLNEMFPHLSVEFALNGVGFIIEGLVILFLGCVAVCLLFYAAMATGYGFARRKGLLSVVFFFLFQFISQVLFFGGITVSFNDPGAYVGVMTEGAVMSQMHLLMLTVIGVEIVYCAVFYAITTLNLSKRLNLE